MSQLEVDKIIPSSGTTLTIGDAGDTINISDGTALTVDSTTFVIDQANNRVGILNSSPTHTLDVSNTSTTAKVLRVGQSSGTSSADATMIISNGGSGDAMLRFDYEGSNTDRARIGVTTSSQHLRFYTAGDNERMIINSSGNVGIGTSSPSFALSVSSASSNTITAINNASNISRFCFAENSTPSNTYTNIEGDARSSGYLAFRTNDSERMRINSSGYVGIGNTNPVKLCEITSNSAYNTAVLLVENGNGSTFNSVVSEIRGGRATTNGTYYLFQGTNGNSSGLFRILDSGNAQNTNNSYGGTSDLKLKENIIDANSQWEDIKALSIKKYSFKLENSEIPTQIGVIAQDLETEGMNGLVEETIDRDEDGTDLGTTTKSVKYSVLYMKAVKCLQEAQTKIETLESTVSDLTTRLEALENA